jgi:phosphoribosylaminoimidazole-succinocarboxamide synthase
MTQTLAQNPPSATSPACALLLDQCADLELDLALVSVNRRTIRLHGPHGEPIEVWLEHSRYSMLEQVFRQLRFDFSDLPLLTRGDSKELRLLTPRVIAAKLLPTVYSFTQNRYGVAPGTDELRARFSAEIFRAMECSPGSRYLASAFLALHESEAGPLLIERLVQSCNLEVRAKRYHIGSPVHRYRYTEKHPTANNGAPVTRWMRFEQPVICFDWRHPLTDEDGTRLSDEPISDDYAALWIDDVASAKRLVRDTFYWLEERFATHGVALIDFCLFVDRSGKVVFGEISPDCMRVRHAANDDADALDKDTWRAGGSPAGVLQKYQALFNIVIGDDSVTE